MSMNPVTLHHDSTQVHAAPMQQGNARIAECAGGPLSVGVLVDLYREPTAGGHVKCWERFAEAAAHEKDLDLTIYFLGYEAETVRVAENVRYVMRKPLLPTDWFAFLRNMPDHTDLAPIRLHLLTELKKHHIIHTTDAFFSMARTALRFAQWTKRPLVSSIHTDTPNYTRVYSAQVIRRIFGDGKLSRSLRDGWHAHHRLGDMMQWKLDRYLRRCDWVLGSDTDELEKLKTALPGGRYSTLRRGIDNDAFHHGKRDRERLHDTFGIDEDRFLLLCAGRLDPDKSVMTLARAARALLDQGAPVHVIFAGEGNQSGKVRELLGERVSLPGSMPQSKLAWIYASADLLVFPSPHEISPNVVVEAKACGLPVVVSAQGGSAQFVKESGRDGIVVSGNDPRNWAEAIEFLRLNPERRMAMGEAGRRWIETEWPTWRDVLREDLMPVWHRVAREKGLWPQPNL